MSVPYNDCLAVLVERHPRAFNGHRPDHSELPEGWLNLACSACHELEEIADMHGRPNAILSQVKPKFGALRLYTADSTLLTGPEKAVVEKAEAASRLVCMVCGRDGQVRRLRWIQTLCERHLKALANFAKPRPD